MEGYPPNLHHHAASGTAAARLLADFPFGLATLCAKWFTSTATDFTMSSPTTTQNSDSPANYTCDNVNALSHPFLYLQCTYDALPTLSTADWCMIVLPIAVYWIYSTFLFVLSYMKITTIELHKIPTDQKMRPKNKITVSHVLKQVAVQHALQALVAYVLAILTTEDGEGGARKMESVPVVVMKLVAAALMLDSYQYWMHRWMHTNRWLYRTFHSVHHELTVLYAYGALYNHPVEGFLMDSIGSGVPALILDMHPWTATIFFCLATLKTVDDHCGYALPWDPFQRFFRNNAVYHDIHHWGKGRLYNFSQPFFTFWDVWMGTDYEMAMQKKALAKAQQSSPSSSPELGPITDIVDLIEPESISSTVQTSSHSLKTTAVRRRARSGTVTLVNTPPGGTTTLKRAESTEWHSDSALGSSCGDSNDEEEE
ncbi:fatty acid hydroxylase superfamily-domain-containing protein [Fimicolochytrium jonesii]|uniref:fatty acid hydroxylase superfamily-domain-containing protein n=1 Tax=Fimicolochytrium jonesii TaxID=1396493 RepID=UPI0022FDBEF8|nr:fatty acid hydroxylase superfamily-domain-containing protein [Fimicolochytrium jonesii]KAI8816364.1 fatty acid hydroxylase superfamily-domain-containing protein [Fimicolochytrium jonesii]